MVASPDTPPPTILVVDDSDANRLLARHTLEDEGYRVVLASGGEEALVAFEREPPDCILLDVRMPGLDGFAVCERVRALPRGHETPVVFLTALRDVETFDRALRAGGDDFLTKPVRPTELVIRVQSALKLRRVSAELREHYDLLKHQRDDLLRLQLQKERLMAFVVHDLKNPVNAMDLQAQVLVRDKALPESAREAAGQIRRTARELGRMILNLLDLSKADEGKLAAKSDPLDLKTLVAAVTGEIEMAAREHGVRIEAAIEAERLAGDDDLLHRVLANLLENAVRHAPRGHGRAADQRPPRRRHGDPRGRRRARDPSRRCGSRSSTRSCSSRTGACRRAAAAAASGWPSAASPSRPTPVGSGSRTRAPVPSSR